MIYLDLFLAFLKIGAVSFGGGYGMLSLIRETVISNGWLTENELINFIAVSESTPGPIAINMATFVGASRGGILGSFLATLGVVLPAFLIILTIASIASGLLKLTGVKAFLSGVKPCVVGLIIATAVTMGLKVLFTFSSVKGGFDINIKSFAILGIILVVHFFIKKILKKKPKPILMIVISAILGMIIYGI